MLRWFLQLQGFTCECCVHKDADGKENFQIHDESSIGMYDESLPEKVAEKKPGIVQQLPPLQCEAKDHVAGSERLKRKQEALKKTQDAEILMESGAYKKSLQLLAAALQMDQYCSRARALRGVCLVKTGKLEEAMAEFETALKDDPDNMMARKWRKELISGEGVPRDPHTEALEKQHAGEAAMLDEKYEEALGSFTAALALNNTLSFSQACRGVCFFKLGLWNEAKPELDIALNADPNNIQALTCRAELKLSEGDFEGAILDYNAKLLLAPGDGQSLYHRAKAKLQKGDKDSAVHDLMMAKRLGFADARSLLKVLRSPDK